MYQIGDIVEFIAEETIHDCFTLLYEDRYVKNIRNTKHKGKIINIYYDAIYTPLSYTIRDYRSGMIYCDVKEFEILSNKKENDQVKGINLENKMIVQTRNGSLYMVVDDVLVESKENGGYLKLSSYSEDLKCYGFECKNLIDYDIMKVYEKCNSFASRASKKVLWTREETKKMKFSNDLRFVSDITDCLVDYKNNGAEKVTITFDLK